MPPITPKSPAPKAARPAKVVKTGAPAKSAGAARRAAAVAAKAEMAPAAPLVVAPAVKAPKQARSGSGPTADMIKLRNLVDTVAATTGTKKPEAKKMVEAVLAAIGAGLAAKSVLVLPPLGKLRVAKANGSVLTLKLRLADASRAAGLALADDEEDS